MSIPTLIIIIAAAASPHGASAVSVLFEQGRGQFSTQQNQSFWRTTDFTFGFKHLVADGDAIEYLLCIWRSADLNQTALWWPSASDFNQTAQVQLSKLGGASNDTGIIVATTTAVLAGRPTVADGTIFSFTSDGSLQLISAGSSGGTTNGTVLWSVGSNASIAELQNTGNLVLHDESNGTIWQSFGDRRDTMIMPAAEQNNSSSRSVEVDLVADNPRLLQSRSSANQSSPSSYAQGRFHMETDIYQNLYLYAVDEYYGAVDFIYSIGSMNVSGYFRVSMGVETYQSNSSMGMSLLRLDPDGNLRVYLWSDSKRVWQQAWQLVQRRCFLGSPCGAFGICQETDDDGSATSFNCTCPPGYSFIDPLHASKGCRGGSDLLNFTSTCDATTSSNYNADSFVMTALINSDYYYGDIGSPQTVASVAECSQLCLQLCECAVASFVVSGNCYLKGNQTGGVLMNGYTTSTNTLLFKLTKGAVESPSDAKRAILGGATAGILVVLLGVATAVLCAVKRRRRKSRSGSGRGLMLLDMDPYGGGEAVPIINFTRQQLVDATDNFRHLLGEGGFGKVYKGWIKQQEETASSTATNVRNSKRRRRRGASTAAAVTKAVAVKVIKAAAEVDEAAAAAAGDHRGSRATRQFRAEVNTLGKIHHINLVNLIGYCCDGDDTVDGRQQQTSMRALVFEFMERGSLDQYLCGNSKKSTNSSCCSSTKEDQQLAWGRRYSIAVGMARGIAYLHHECSPPILHSDIKPQNVLLDGAFTAKVADFGFARRFQETKTHLTMSAVQGTRGYMAPEWLKTDEITSKVDVYSFGVVLLELVRGLCDYYRHLHLEIQVANDRHRDEDPESYVEDAGLPLVEWAFRYLERVSMSTTPEKVLSVEAVTASIATSDETGDEGSSGVGDVERWEKVQVLKIGLWCVQHAPQMRPSMQQVLRLLEEAAAARKSGSGGGSYTIEMPPYPAPKVLRVPPPFLHPLEDSVDSASCSTSCLTAASYASSNFVEAQSAVSAR